MPRPGAIAGEALGVVLRGKTVTIRYPFEPAVRPERVRGKMKHDLEKCRGCGLCKKDCPASAIEMIPTTETKTKKKPQFDLARCIFCGTCEAHCPAKAIEFTTEFEMACFTPKGQIVVTEDPKE
jgi:formate hydrogenlyase subunit 6/NADH:ubiquinone oxidoreductase subunit I